MQRYYIKDLSVYNINQEIIINQEDSFHITKVMRMKINDQIIVFNDNYLYVCEIVYISNSKSDLVRVKILNELFEQREMPLKVTIAQGLIRREKQEEVIEKLTELGAYQYYPVQMEFCNVKYKEEKKAIRQLRIEKIIKEATEQSFRQTPLIVNELITFNDLLKLSSNYDLLIVADTTITDSNKLLESNLKTLLNKKEYKNILAVIGPEGGLSYKELTKLDEMKFNRVSLGPRILRTEVAPLYLMSAISYEKENK